MRPQLAAGTVTTVVVVVVLVAVLAGVTALLVVRTVQVRRLRRAVDVLEARVASLEHPGGPDHATGRPRAIVAAEKTLRTVVDTAVKVRRRGVGGLLLSSLDDLSRWALEDRSEIVRMAAGDGSVTLMFSDIEGSTTMNDELGDEGWVELLIAHDAIVRAHVARRGGHVVKSQGDGFMLAFPEPAGAVKAALDVQRSFSEAHSRLLRRSPISVRVGIHCGPVVTRGEDLFGLNVAIAARVAAQAQGGETLLSDEVASGLVDDPRFLLGHRRTVELKGVPGERTLTPVTRAPRRPLAQVVTHG